MGGVRFFIQTQCNKTQMSQTVVHTIPAPTGWLSTTECSPKQLCHSLLAVFPNQIKPSIGNNANFKEDLHKHTF